MIALVFSYEVVRDAAEFERVYGTDGEWAEFFKQGRGYIGTEFLRDVEAPGRYLVIDRWESADAYNAFVAAHREEYMPRASTTRASFASARSRRCCDVGRRRSRISLVATPLTSHCEAAGA